MPPGGLLLFSLLFFPLMHAEFVLSVADPSHLPQNDRPHIALVGRSNVGKSSLVNALAQQTNLARVSSAPGRTQTMNLYAFDRRFYIVDLPGYGYAKTSQEQRVGFADMLDAYLADTPQLCLVVLVLDARLGPTAYDQEMVARLRELGLPFLILANKIDKMKPREADLLLNNLREFYPDVQIIAHSSLSPRNRDLLLRLMFDAVRGKDISSS